MRNPEDIIEKAKADAARIFPVLAVSSPERQRQQEKIIMLENKLKAQLHLSEPIDARCIGELLALKQDRAKDALQWRGERFEEMKAKTRELTARFNALFPDGTKDIFRRKPDVEAGFWQMNDLFDEQAVQWLNDEVCPWEDSKAAQTAQALIILANEIR